MTNTTRYELILFGHLDKCWETWFDGIQIRYEESNSVIFGEAKDQAEIMGVLNKFHGLGLKIRSMRLVD